MKLFSLVITLALGLVIVGCGVAPTSLPTETVTPTASPTLEPTKTPLPPTVTPNPTNSLGLPDSVIINGDTISFPEWGFAIDIPADIWSLDQDMYKKESDFEGFVFLRKEYFFNENNEAYSPSIGILFYSIPENAGLVEFSAMLRAHLGANFPSIDSMFGYEGSEPKLIIPALGYYGHLGEEKAYSIYIVHTVNSTTGIQVSFEIVDSVLDQAQPEFFAVMQSMTFIEKEIPQLQY